MKRWFLIHALALASASAGPYSAGLGDAANPFDAPVPGFTGPHGSGKARLDDGTGVFENPGNYVNPLFFHWADEVADYLRSDNDAGFSDPSYALGPVTGDPFDIVSLGDQTDAQIANGEPPGQITLRFAKPIRNRSGADFVVFENGFTAQFNTGGSGAGGLFSELAHVEVSADGVNFVRFPSTSLTASSVGGYGSLDPTAIRNLAGKHINAYAESWGTPFDLAELSLDQVSFIRIVDIPGDGSVKDSAGRPIYDAWRTFGSGGFDLEAAGAISTDMSFAEWPSLQRLDAGARGPDDDPDRDGIPNLMEYALALDPWTRDAPDSGCRLSIIEVDGAHFCEIVTRRDERLVDLVREIQTSDDMSSWQTLATSTAGAPFVPAAGQALEITDEPAAGIASVGVIRRDRIRAPLSAGPHFYRLKLTRTAP